MEINQRYLDEFENYGIESHNIAEIKKLKLLKFEDDSEHINKNSKIVLVLVVPRLLTRTVLSRLERMKKDLKRDGYRSRFISTDLYRGRRHQDGRSILAMREFFRDVHKYYRNFKGAILIGDFPDAMLVRRCIWRQVPKNRDQWLKINSTPYEGIYMMMDPEVVADRTDIVLSDLTGHWENCYREGPEQLDSIYAISEDQSWTMNDETFSSRKYRRTTKTFNDFFWLNENDYNVTEDTGNSLKLTYNAALNNPEVSPEDRKQSNPIARPDIFISKINSLHIALDPNPGYQDINGNRFLARDGKPQAVVTGSPVPNGQFGDLRHRNFSLERRLLCEYLDRNHDWRNNKINVLVQCATIAYEKDGKFDAGDLARGLGGSELGFYDDTIFDDATLLDYIKFLKTSALIKGVIAHSGGLTTQFGENYDIEELEQSVGGRPWMWHKVGAHRFNPSFADQKGRANVYLYRTIYANKILGDQHTSIYLHAGCDVNSPHKASSDPYTSKDYGWFQNAEGILFYLKGLAVVSRAKTFNDYPAEFIKGFMSSKNANIGDGYYTLFKADGNNAALASSANKRSYTWGIVGDWTLKREHKKMPVLRDWQDSHGSGFLDSE